MDAFVSMLRGFEGVDLSGSGAEDVGGGGGSMMVGDGLDIGSGSAGIGSSADEVSMVMCWVTGGLCRIV